LAGLYVAVWGGTVPWTERAGWAGAPIVGSVAESVLSRSLIFVSSCFSLVFCFFCCYDCSSMFVAPVLALLLMNGLADSSALLPMLALPSHYN
jgi:hypothetical protein